MAVRVNRAEDRAFEVVTNTTREDRTRQLITAAQEWVERISSHPNSWADDEDFAVIEAVRALVPGVRCQWTENPAYAGWTEAWHDGR